MIRFSLKLDVSLSKLVIACIGSAACYGVGCYIYTLNDSPALESNKGKTEVIVKSINSPTSENDEGIAKVHAKSKSPHDLESGEGNAKVHARSKSPHDLESGEGSAKVHTKSKSPHDLESGEGNAKFHGRSKSPHDLESGEGNVEVHAKSKSPHDLGGSEGAAEIQEKCLPKTKDNINEKENIRTKTHNTNKVTQEKFSEKSIPKTKHHEQVSATKVEPEISTPAFEAANELHSDLNDSNDVIRTNNFSQSKADTKNKQVNKNLSETSATTVEHHEQVSATKVEFKISKSENEASNESQYDLNSRNDMKQASGTLGFSQNKTDQQRMFVVDESLLDVLKQQNHLFYNLSSYFNYYSKFLENKFKEMKLQNINISTSSMDVINAAFEDFRDQFNSNYQYYSDENIVFSKFASNFEDIVGDILTEIIFASEKQQKKKERQKNRKLLVKNEKALFHLKNYTTSVSTVFDDIFSFIENFAPGSNLTNRDVAERVKYWNIKVNDIKLEIQRAEHCLECAKETVGCQDISEQFSKLFDHFNVVVERFQSDLCSKMTVERGSEKISMMVLM